MRTLFKILGIRPRRLRRPKMVTVVRVEIIYGDDRPDLHMTLAPEEYEDLAEAWAMDHRAVALRINGAFVVVSLENVSVLSRQYAQGLER